MRYTYGPFDGNEFPTMDSLGAFENLIDFVLQYGEQALDALEDVDDETARMLQQLLDQGLLEKARGKWRLTPRAISQMQRRALMEIFQNLRRSARESHPTRETGTRGERTDGTRAYQFGDALSDLDLHATLSNSLARCGPGLPIRIAERDFELFHVEGQASLATVILLDMSGSMYRYNRFFAAKKVAMAVHALIKQAFPADSLDLVGFASTAEQIEEGKLPLLMPKPVTVHDWQVRVVTPLSKAADAPQHFTNLHMGLMMARRILSRRGSENKQIFIITDGQPTAHLEGDILHLLYPPDRRSTIATLKEALNCARQGIRIATFALIEDYEGMEWVSFVDQLTRLVKGTAFYTTSGDLAGCVMESYMSGRRKRAFLS